MAELNVSRNRRAVPKVDLTAMVDLAFLLITFFMLTTSLSKPIAMDIAKPDETTDEADLMPVSASRTMTILLGRDNKVIWYMGAPETAKPVVESFAQIRKSILANKKKVASDRQNTLKKPLFVIVKPTSASAYRNFVDIMDELSLADLKVAPAIDDDHILKEEIAFLKQKNMMN